MHGRHPIASRDAAVSLVEPLLDAAAVAALLGVPRSTVLGYTHAAHDPLPCLRVGRHVRFQREAVQIWLSRRQGPGGR